MLEFDQIKEALNGHGRIIYYIMGSDFSAEQQELKEIQEGHFRNGLMDGYSRRFNVAGSPHVQLGFFKDGLPMGKY